MSENPPRSHENHEENLPATGLKKGIEQQQRDLPSC